ncbi:MAG TPA: hypothetical protein VK550_01110 [Polyangiaceae bacterium]|nr:hypothetical protein [Polyangiaceae bacterium]
MFVGRAARTSRTRFAEQDLRILMVAHPMPRETLESALHLRSQILGAADGIGLENERA